MIDILRLFISLLTLLFNLSLCRNLRYYTVEESLWCRVLHTIFTCYRGKTLNFLKIFWRPGSTFSELAALRIQGRGTVAFIQSGINEKSIYDGTLCTIVDAKNEIDERCIWFSNLSIFLNLRKIRINKRKII